MKKVVSFLMILALLLPMAVVACHCCPSMSAPAPSEETILSSSGMMSCCFMMALFKELAPKIEKFVPGFLHKFLAFIQSEIVAPLSVAAKPESDFARTPDFISSEPPRYLALSVLRI